MEYSGYFFLKKYFDNQTKKQMFCYCPQKLKNSNDIFYRVYKDFILLYGSIYVMINEVSLEGG